MSKLKEALETAMTGLEGVTCHDDVLGDARLEGVKVRWTDAAGETHGAYVQLTEAELEKPGLEKRRNDMASQMRDAIGEYIAEKQAA